MKNENNRAVEMDSIHGRQNVASYAHSQSQMGRIMTHPNQPEQCKPR